MGEGNPRRPRVAQAIREVLGELIRDNLTDPRLSQAGFLSINHVDLNKDMGVADIYIGFYGDEDGRKSEAAIRALQGASGRLRGPLGRELRLQRSPELRFHLDQSGEFGIRMSEIIRDDEVRRQRNDLLEERDAEEGDE